MLERWNLTRVMMERMLNTVELVFRNYLKDISNAGLILLWIDIIWHKRTRTT